MHKSLQTRIFTNDRWGDHWSDRGQDYLKQRLAQLAVLRELQLHRQTDIMRLRQHLCPRRDVEPKLMALLTRYRKAGGVTSTPLGKDKETGYSYQRWRVKSVRAIVEVNQRLHLPLMPASGKAEIEQRQNLTAKSG